MQYKQRRCKLLNKSKLLIEAQEASEEKAQTKVLGGIMTSSNKAVTDRNFLTAEHITEETKQKLKQ